MKTYLLGLFGKHQNCLPLFQPSEVVIDFIYTRTLAKTANCMLSLLVAFLLIAPINLILGEGTECGCSRFDLIGTDSESESYISMETLTPGFCFDVRGTLYIDEETEWNNITVIMREGSKIVVQAPFSVTNGTIITGCTTMWQGIHTTGVGKLTITDCIIEKAEFGVKLVPFQEFTCKNVEFISDYIGIAAGSPFDENNDFIKISQDGEITGCKFYTDGSLPAPYPGQYYDLLYSGWPGGEGGIIYDKMYAAVYMKNCIGLTLGSRAATGTDKNEIYEARNGVIVLNSNSYVVKTIFHDFTGQFASPFIHNPGTLKVNQVGIYSNRSMVNIEWNYVEDVYVGVWGIEASDDIKKNEFHIYNGTGLLAYTKGIHEETPQKLNISDNQVYNGFKGIWVNNGTRYFNINKNYLERSLTRADNEGIRVDGYHVLGSAPAVIFDNDITIDNARHSVGISLQDITGIKTDFNHIDLGPLFARNHNAGIAIFSGMSCVISRNVITADAVFNNQETDMDQLDAGLAVVDCKLSHVACNEMENFDNNLWVVGPNTMTYLKRNSIKDGNRGFELYGPAFLGIQEHYSNGWIGDYDEIGAIATGPDPETTAELSTFYVDSGDEGGIFLPPTFSPEDWFIDQAGLDYSCPVNTIQIPPVGSVAGNFIRTHFEFEKYDDEMHWIAYANLYDILLKHDSLLAYYPLDSFFSVQEVEPLGELMQVRDNLNKIPSEHFEHKFALENNLKSLTNDLISIDSIITLSPIDKLDWLELRELKCDTILDSLGFWLGILETESEDYLDECEDALTDLSGITSRNNLEDHLKESLRMKASVTLDGYLSSGDSTDLADFLLECSWKGSYGLGIDYNLYAEITDSVPGHSVHPCSSSEPLAERADYNKELNDQIQVSPNPANEVVNITSTLDITKVNLFDFTGKMLINIYPGKNSYSIDVHALNPGVYLLNVILSKESHAIKIVIQR